MSKDPVKQGITNRFLEAINFLVDRKFFKSPRDYGLKNNLSAQTLSDFKAGRSDVEIKHVYNIAKKHPFINLYYIVLGEESLQRKKTPNFEELGISLPQDESFDIEEVKDRLKKLEEFLRKNQDKFGNFE